MVKPEILAPAGNFEKLKFALEYGADAVYLSGKNFGLRSSSDNFSLKEMDEAIKFVHARGKKVYVTVNIFPYNTDIENIEQHISFIADIKADGIIISDLGVFSIARQMAPKIPIHISVQANNLNYKEVEMWKNLGAKRIILARELKFEDIQFIKEKVKDIELEVFVHGAVCMSLSGRCLISNYLTGRDANRGKCAQACRWSYDLIEEKRQGEHIPIIEDDRGTYILNSKDLCTINKVHKFAEIGINSLKIEGRMKSIHYVAVTTAAYQNALGKYIKNTSSYKPNFEWMEELEKISHREYTEGFYFSDDIKQNIKTAGYIRKLEYLGYVKDKAIKSCTVMVKGTFKTGDEIEFFCPDFKVIKRKVRMIKNIEGIEELYTKQSKEYEVFFDKMEGIKNYSILRKNFK